MKVKCRGFHSPLLYLILTFAGVFPAHAAGPLDLKERWFYLSTNLLTPANVDKADELFQRAEKAGYTGVLLTDSKFSNLQSERPAYVANVERLKKSASDHHIEIIPGVFPLGYSCSLLANDPNLAEGLPAKDALFVVKNGEARLEPDPVGAMVGGAVGVPSFKL